ncbi:hypothetical protein ACLOJK_024422 [Asimina triloba]
MAEKLAPEKRHSFVHGGQKVFEWDQTLEEVNMYITLPPNVPNKKLFYCDIQSKHIQVGIRGNPPYLNVGIPQYPFLRPLCFSFMSSPNVLEAQNFRRLGLVYVTAELESCKLGFYLERGEGYLIEEFSTLGCGLTD